MWSQLFKSTMRSHRIYGNVPCHAPLCLLLNVLVLAGVGNGGDFVPFTQEQPRDFSRLKSPSVSFEEGPVVPGLHQGATPQGLTFVSESNKLLISHYFSNAPSRISVLDRFTGKFTSSIILKDGPTETHHGHVGGIAALGNSLWVASDGKVLQYDLAPFIDANLPSSVIPKAIHIAETGASFCTSTANTLFVGEFAYGLGYRTKRSHHHKDRKGINKYAWVCGYSSSDPMGTPKCILSIRQRAQGMYVTSKRIYLSLSYGRRNRSKIVIYQNPLNEAAHTTVTTSANATVPLWFLDGKNYLAEIDFPPMAEGITMIDGRLAVLSESGAIKYQRRTKGPLDLILMLDVNTFSE